VDNNDNPEITPVEPQILSESVTPETPTVEVNIPHSRPEPRISRERSSSFRDLLIRAREKIQFKKKKKLDKIMEILNKKEKISNDEVEKILHVSDATATRYLSILEQEGKITQNGKTGKGVFYSKI
jgi:predicted HTH transcriptional regulator